VNLTKILKALADENRLRILNLLAQRQLCVCEIEAVLGFTQSNASRHLIKLKEAGVIDHEKQGQFVIYNLNEAAFKRHLFLKEVISALPADNPLFRADLEKLERIGDSCRIQASKT
jgi:ArsR family transcriptional regulator